jgi:hypothetical protein
MARESYLEYDPRRVLLLHGRASTCRRGQGSSPKPPVLLLSAGLAAALCLACPDSWGVLQLLPLLDPSHELTLTPRWVDPWVTPPPGVHIRSVAPAPRILLHDSTAGIVRGLLLRELLELLVRNVLMCESRARGRAAASAMNLG